MWTGRKSDNKKSSYPLPKTGVLELRAGRSLTLCCTEWGSFAIRTCSLSLAVQDVKHNSSNKENWTAQGHILTFRVIVMQFS